MKLSIIGCGYLGAVHAASMVELGHDVIGIDVDAAKIAMLSEGRPPFFEPGLPEILTSAIASGRLRFSTDIADAQGAVPDPALAPQAAKIPFKPRPAFMHVPPYQI